MEAQLLADARTALLRLAAAMCVALAAGPPDAAAVRMRKHEHFPWISMNIYRAWHVGPLELLRNSMPH